MRAPFKTTSRDNSLSPHVQYASSLFPASGITPARDSLSRSFTSRVHARGRPWMRRRCSFVGQKTPWKWLLSVRAAGICRGELCTFGRENFPLASCLRPGAAGIFPSRRGIYTWRVESMEPVLCNVHRTGLCGDTPVQVLGFFFLILW